MITHLYIELNGITEEVNSLIIEKLYNLASSGDLDNTSDLKGRLHSTLGYDTEVTYLNEHFSDLHISVDKALLPFKEKWIADKIIAKLANFTNTYSWAQTIVNDNGFTRETASQVPLDHNNFIANALTSDEWASVKYFNELGYFTSYTSMNNSNWRDLIEIDCSNINSITQYGLCFNNCTNLTKLTYNPQKLTLLNGAVFHNCTNLNIDINVPNNAGNCDSSFKNSGIQRILNPGPGLTLAGNGQYTNEAFKDCKSLKYISIPYNCTSEYNISQGNSDRGYIFSGCNALECVIFNCQSVFTLGSTNHFNGGTNANFKVYVPDSLVNDYKADTYWSTWSSHIFGISLLQTDNAEYYQLWQDYTDHSAEPSNT